MNRQQGLTFGSIVLAGLLLRPSLVPNQQSEPSQSANSVSGLSARPEEVKGPGPWIASCNYWAPARALVRAADQDKSPANEGKAGPQKKRPATLPNPPLQINVAQLNGSTVQVNIDQRDKELGCEDEEKARWGFPGQHDSISVDMVIATVPDPVHTHQAMVFDRTIDALLRAAAANGYTSSYYWLPWKHEPPGLETAIQVDRDAEPGHDPERERQPGVLIVRKADEPNHPKYIFLVGESPTEGLDGFQLQNAFLYERDIQKYLPNQTSRGRGPNTSIIGPIYTGSAASLRSALESEIRVGNHTNSEIFEVSGITATEVAAKALNAPLKEANLASIRYYSFEENETTVEQILARDLESSGYDKQRLAILIEANTAYGRQSIEYGSWPLQIRFPREISLLRNTENIANGQDSSGRAQSVPSPYLHLSLKDSGAMDAIPQFSRENTPLSQESQLMAISRELQRYRAQYIAIVASNPLDEIFLAEFLHRSCPDARLLFFESDLLMEREVDNVPFIGAITATPYPQIGGLTTLEFPSSVSVDYYNAAIFGLRSADKYPPLMGYLRVSLKDGSAANKTQPPLWITVAGVDGYYPLGIISPCASYGSAMLPALDASGTPKEPLCDEKAAGFKLRAIRGNYYPSLLWSVFCVAICLLCMIHMLVLSSADYWSPITRDLAIADNDTPRRRSMYVNVGVAMLFCMASIVTLPVFCMKPWVSISGRTLITSIVTLGLGVGAVLVSIAKVGRFSLWQTSTFENHVHGAALGRLRAFIASNIYFFINCVSALAAILIPCFWAYLCLAGHEDSALSYKGLFFCVRCVNPASGVSPLVPILLLLLGWYLWAFFQTRRLRFSDWNRPYMPDALPNEDDNRFFVSDNELAKRGGARRSNLYRYMTCLFVTREVLRQPIKGGSGTTYLDLSLLLIYLSALVCSSVFNPIHSLNHLFWKHMHIAEPYEMLVGALFFPLLIVALAGWFRTLLVWIALRRGVLERLENQPIRFAFSRLKGVGWVTMLRQSGLHDQWRDIARSVESMRQILHDSDVKGVITDAQMQELDSEHRSILGDADQLRENRTSRDKGVARLTQDFRLMHQIELRFATFSRLLLAGVCIPFWKDERTGFVEGADNEEIPLKARRWRMEATLPNIPGQLHLVPEPADSAGVILAEEFLAIRYVALIRAVLANLRYLMLFVSTSFVLTIIAWNSYPFQPRRQVDWIFTALLFLLGSGIIWVFAQMYRNPILSRITETRPNELGAEFYIRVIGFGALPVLTWLAYQFPAVGSMIYRLVQPALSVTQ
jgi:hypothetical protein